MDFRLLLEHQPRASGFPQADPTCFGVMLSLAPCLVHDRCRLTGGDQPELRRPPITREGLYK